MVQKASAEFARYFLECVRVRIPTIQTMKILLDMKEKPLVCLIAQELNESLCKGESFENTLHTPYVEHALQQFFQIALHGSNCEKMLEGYLVMNQQRHIKQVRIFTRSVQLSCYVTIGLILLVGAVSKNQSIIIATIFVMILKFLPFTDNIMLEFKKKGINWGVLVITIAILIPIATKEIGFLDLINAFKSPIGWVAILSGIGVSLLSAKSGEVFSYRLLSSFNSCQQRSIKRNRVTVSVLVVGAAGL